MNIRHSASWRSLARLLGAGLAAAAGLAAVVALAAPRSADAAAAANWLSSSPATMPPALSGPSLAYDPASHQTILFGQSDGNAETWNWNGYTWTQLKPGVQPPARSYAAMAYDPAVRALVLFGGLSNENQQYNDTWLWNGSTWTALTPTASTPSARALSSLAYDQATGQLILFGGDSNGTYLNSTYVLNSANLTWTKLDPATAPASRAASSLAYDTATRQLVLYGGENGQKFADTWLWTGTNWTSAGDGAPVPQVRAFASFAYDATTSQLILFGGTGADDKVYGDTWDWTGTAWTQLSPAASPGPASDAAASYDGDTHQLVLFGGVPGEADAWQNDTWTYGPPLAAPALTGPGTVTFKTGTTHQVTLGSTGYPLPLFSTGDGLPSGLSLSPTGILSGKPANGTGKAYDVLITATNGAGSAASEDLLIVVDQAPVITSARSATFVAGSEGRFKVKASAYPAAKFTKTGALPGGVTLSKAGVLSGTPMAAGTYKVELIATNSSGTSKQAFTLTVDPGTPANPAPVITSLNNATFVIGSPGKFTVKANEQATFTETGTLPAGLTLSSAGVLSGVPQSEGTYKIELYATNANGTGKQAFTLTIDG